MKSFPAIIFLVTIYCNAAAQNVGIGTQIPHSSAQLDVTSTNKGILVPRVSLTHVSFGTPIAAPAEGLLVWNTNAGTTNGQGTGFYFWAGSRWQKLTSAAEGWSLTGNSNIDTAVNFIGTTSNTGLMFRVRNLKAGGIFPIGGNTFLGKSAGQFIKLNTLDFFGENNTFIGSDAGAADSTAVASTYIGSRAGYRTKGSFGNTFVGASAGAGSTTGTHNTAVGLGAGGSSTGSRNVSMGAEAGDVGPGNENVMLGYKVASSVQGGNGNVWIGSNAGTGNFGFFPKAISDNNVFIGDSAAYQTNGAQANVFIGKRSGLSSTASKFNVFVGDSSGIYNNTGNLNTFIGSKAGGSIGSITNATAIGAKAQAAGNNVVVLGSIEGINGATESVNVGIGNANPNRRLYIQDGTSSGVNSSSNSLLVLDKTGGPNYISILNGNTFESGLIFARAGSPQPPFDGGIFYNVGGLGAMQFRNKGGLTRMFIHDNGNISMGNVNSSHNLYVAQAGQASGVAANANTMLVLDRGTTSANYLSMLGTTGELGLMFGTSNAVLDGGVFFNTSAVLRGLSFRTGNVANRMVIASDGNVGMGTITPDYKLHVSTNLGGNNGIFGGIMVQNTSGTNPEAAVSFKNAGTAGTGINQWMIGLNANRNFSFSYGSQFLDVYTKVLIDSTGRMGIGTITPSQRLHVVGNILATGTITPSDARLKTNIVPMASLLPQVMALQPMYYHWKQDEFPQYEFSHDRTLGVMAQALETNFPELVVTGSDGYKAVDYSRLSVVVLKAVQEQQETIIKQETEIQLLKKRLDALEKRGRKVK